MGKGEKTGLGRSLVKQHNHMLLQNKEKGQFYKTINNKVLTSITEVSDIDAVLEQAAEAEQIYSHDNPVPNLLVDNGDSSSSTTVLTPEDKKKLQKQEEALHAGSLRVPRRPPWNAQMTVDELDVNETQSFLSWRRGLAKLEENEKLVLTPFEKNLDIWRQLWRVVERSDLLVMVVDARDPLFYRCPDLEVYVQEVDEHKRTMLLINKADLLPHAIRLKWAKYFNDHGILFLFWSAKAASAALEGKDLVSSCIDETVQEPEDSDTKVYGREELLARLQYEAEEIVRLRKSRSNSTDSSHSNSSIRRPGVNPDSVTVGFVGYPNVGKSSTINALVGQKRAGVTNTPGKTKHFQTLIMSEKLTLCDCPGLVFPSFTSSRHEMIACGVLPIDRMTNQRDAVQVVADKVPRSVLEEVYKISLPKPKPYESQSRPPLASELMRAYCAARGYTASSGLPDETRAARQILKDYIDGKLTHFELPPGMSTDDIDESNEPLASNLSGIDESDEYDSSDIEESPSINETEVRSDLISDVMSDLDSFDLANGLLTEKKPNERKKPPKAPHKLHRKPQRKKDRSWRTVNDGGDGTPLVGVYKKPVNTGPLKI